MTTKVTTLSDLIHRAVSSSCLNYRPLQDHILEQKQKLKQPSSSSTTSSEEQESESGNKEEENGNRGEGSRALVEMELLMEEVFDTVTSMKIAYTSLQQAHCPWDPHRMRAADESVISELRKLSRLKDTFRRKCARNIASRQPPPPLREAVFPYEAALLEARRELKVRDAEVENLKHRLQSAPMVGRRKGRVRSTSTVHTLGSTFDLPANPTPELFVWCIEQVKSASKSFANHLISLMRSSSLDIIGATDSILRLNFSDCAPPPSVGSHHARHVIESYVSRKIFQGFENESFYMEGTLSSLLNPEHHRSTCFAQFKDMRSMDPSEMLGVLPTCHFGKWAAKKYLSIMDSKMENSLDMGMNHRRKLESTEPVHPRTGFYGEYLKLAKSVWLLHLLAFAMDPSPTHFEASNGTEFQPEYMESVVRFPGDRVPASWIVGFGVGPGFKLGNGSVIKAWVYPIPPPIDH